MKWRTISFKLLVISYLKCCHQLCTKTPSNALHTTVNSSHYTSFPSNDNASDNSYFHKRKTIAHRRSTTSGVGNFFVWDKTSMTALQYQNSLCGRRCNGAVPVDVTSLICFTFKCVACECKRPACEIYNNCCPDVSEEVLPVTLKTGDRYPYGSAPAIDGVRFEIHRNRSRHPVLGCEQQRNYTFLYIKSCPPDFLEHPDSKDTISLCENDLPADQQTVDTFVRVYDHLTRAVYRNRFCAQCNSVKKIIPIVTELSCENCMSLYTARNIQELLRLQLMSGQCHVMMSPPHDVLMECENVIDGQQIPIMDTCNSDIMRKPVDDDVVRACSELTGNKYIVFEEKSPKQLQKEKNTYKHYRNIFCAICNEKSYPETKVCSTNLIRPSEYKLPFTLLLNFRREGQLKASENLHKWLSNSFNCSFDQWASPLGQSFQLKCVPGKMLQNDSCVPIFPEIKGLGYNLRLLFEFQPEQNFANSRTSETIIAALLNAMENLLIGLSDEYSINIGTIHPQSQPNMATANKLYWINMNVIAKSNLSRQRFELQMNEAFLDGQIKVNISDGKMMRSFSYQLTFGSFGSFKCNISENSTIKSLKLFVNEAYKLRRDMKSFEEHFIRLSKLLTCSFISFNTSVYRIDVSCDNHSPRVTVTVDLSVIKLVFTDPKDMVMMEVDTDDKLNVCQELINREVQRLQQNLKRRLYNTPLSGLDLAEYVITLSCLCASMICLLLTLMTYFRLGSLRTEAGINNMFLSGSLLLAQVSLLASAHLQGPSVLCTVLGVSTHFLWLWMFSWNFICSFHMFRVFTAKVRAALTISQGGNIQILRRFVASLLLPLPVTAAVMLTSYFTPRRSSIGYGEFNCYLNSNFLVGVAMISPLALILISNTVFFFVTIYKIYKVRGAFATGRVMKDDRKNLIIYFKLSTVTGVFWALYVVAEAVENNVLRIISIFFNGLQGVLIFLSYICNKRVLKLLTEGKRSNSLERNQRITHSEEIAEN